MGFGFGLGFVKDIYKNSCYCLRVYSVSGVFIGNSFDFLGIDVSNI